MSFKKSACCIWTIAALLLVPSYATAQGIASLLGGKAQAAPAAAASTDPLNRDTPRDAIYAFLQKCHAENYVVAAQYLDLRRLRADQRTAQGPDLAKALGELLDRNPHFEVSRLSNTATGNLADGLAPDLETLATFPAKGQDEVLQMRRVTVQNTPVWLVSAESVALIPSLAAMASESPIESRLPEPLVSIRFIGTSLWIWIALVLLALVLSALSRLLSRLALSVFRSVFRGVAKKYATQLHTFRLEVLLGPLRLLIVVLTFGACMQAIAPSALLRDYLLKILTLLFFVGAAALAMRIVDIISDQVITRLDPRAMALSYSILPLVVRFVKLCVFCLAALSTLSFWGYNTNAILAGVGVGGLAVALAAQKTIENLFGGISVITDRPVLVGDFCQFGGQVGTVEDIGLRSTRIRTLDRTVVTVPNSQFSTMTLENYSKRDRMWFHPTVQLDRDTTPEQIRQMMEALTRILQDHPKVQPGNVPIRFTKITKESHELELFAYVMTPESDEFLRVQTELLIQFVEAARRIGVHFAVPFQESFVKVHPPQERTPSEPRQLNDGSSAPSTATAGASGSGTR